MKAPSLKLRPGITVCTQVPMTMASPLVVAVSRLPTSKHRASARIHFSLGSLVTRPGQRTRQARKMQR